MRSPDFRPSESKPMQCAKAQFGVAPATLELVLDSDWIAVRGALSQVLIALEPRSLTPDQQGTLELILAEVLNNIVEHAYEEQLGTIALRLRAEEQAVWCEVMDQGREMPGGTPPTGGTIPTEAELAALAVQDLPEGGFGWSLIRALTQDLHYEREGMTNRLSFRFSLVVEPSRA